MSVPETSELKFALGEPDECITRHVYNSHIKYMNVYCLAYVNGEFFISSPVSPLTYICNRMLSTGTFPDRLKYSEIKPIY